MPEEKIYTIPIRAEKKTRVKRSAHAVRIVRAFLKKHSKADEIKLGRKLNEAVWSRGAKKPPSSVRVKAVKDAGVVRAELLGFDYEEFRAKPKEEKKGMKERLMERLGPKAQQKQELEEKIEGKAEEKNE
ncbi:MAG: 50S ribosomal protein L31e [Candidatus Aenigmarchaeota archaeon]|nr:50S ribosomal protein L31e [Candidatus Aenigmarchaeota archaeon]